MEYNNCYETSDLLMSSLWLFRPFISPTVFQFLPKAGLRTLHELGPKIKRAISGDLVDDQSKVEEEEAVWPFI